MERMLNGKLKLHDIEDVELFCYNRIDAYCKKRNMRLSPDDHEDLMAFAISQVWELFDGKWNESGSFSGYVSYILPKRFTDYFRAKWGRDGQKLSIETAIPFSAMGTIATGVNDYDKADSAAYVSGLLLR